MEELTSEVKILIEKAKKLFKSDIEIKYDTKKSGNLTHYDGEQYLDGGKLVIKVNDMTDYNFIVAHELLHFLDLFRDIPKISFNLLDNGLLMEYAIDIYDTILHTEIYDKQRNMNLINEKTENFYLNGIIMLLNKENEFCRRVLFLFDALVFFKGNESKITDFLGTNFQNELNKAGEFYTILKSKTIDNAFSMRRIIVKLFSFFDENFLLKAGLRDFVTVSAVLSSHQERIAVEKMFLIEKAKFESADGIKEPYVGYMKSSRQNTFILEKRELTPQIMKLETGLFLKMCRFPYLKR